MDRTAGQVRTVPAVQGCGSEGTLLQAVAEPAGFGTALRLAGEIDMSSVSALASAISAHQENLRVLDLREVTFIDCRGMQVLIDATARARAEGRRLSIMPCPVLRRLIDLFDTRDMLDIAAQQYDIRPLVEQ